MSEFKRKIIGNWKNDEFEYNFKVDGIVIINRIKLKSITVRKWKIEGNAVSFKDGSLPEPWGGTINYITDTEISITDMSDEVGKITIMKRIYSESIDKIIGFNTDDFFLENSPVEEVQKEKNFKEKASDFLGLIFLLAFLGGLIGLLGYAGYEEFRYQSHGYLSFITGILFLTISVIFAIPAIITLKEKYLKSFSEQTFIYLVLGFIFGIPIIYLLLKSIFLILMLWYYILVIVAITFIIYIFSIKKLNVFSKIVIILCLLGSIYFLFDAKKIFIIKFDVYFDNKKIEYSGNNEEPRV